MATTNNEVSLTLKLLGAQRFKSESTMAATAVKDIGKGAKVAEREFSGLERRSRYLGGTLRKLAGAGLALGGGFAAYEKAKGAIESTAELAKETAKLHKVTGLSIRDGSALLSLGHTRGLQDRAVAQGLTLLSKSTIAATKTTTAHTRSLASYDFHAGIRATSTVKEVNKQAKAFRTLGISQQDVKRGSKDVEYLLGKVADGLSHGKGSPEKAAAATVLLGRSWQTLYPLLKDGGDGLQRNIDLADKYGATLDEKTLGAMEKLEKVQQTQKLGWIGLQTQFTEKVSPALQSMSKDALHLIGVLSDKRLTPNQKISQFTDELDRIDIGGHLATAIKAGVPIAANAAAKAAPKLAWAFVKGFQDAGIWGQLFTVGFLGKKTGAFAALGKLAASKIGKGAAGETAGKLLGRGATPLDPLFVAVVNKGGLPGGGPGSALSTVERDVGKGAAATWAARAAKVGRLTPEAIIPLLLTDVVLHNNKNLAYGPGGAAARRAARRGGGPGVGAGAGPQGRLAGVMPMGAVAGYHDSGTARANSRPVIQPVRFINHIHLDGKKVGEAVTIAELKIEAHR